MLCIIFTDEKMHAGALHPTPHLLDLGDRPHLVYDGSMLNGLQQHLETILQIYRNDPASKEASLPIPLTLVFPLGVIHKKKAESAEVIKWLRQNNEYFRLVYADNLSSAFIAGLFKDQQTTESGHLVLESFDEFVNICYHHPKQEGRLSEYIPIRELGWSKGRQKVLEIMTKLLEQEGLSLKEEDKIALLQQIDVCQSDHRYMIKRNSNQVSIQAGVFVTYEDFLDQLSYSKALLKDYFSKKKLQQFNIYNVSLIGNYFGNPVLQDFIRQEVVGKDYLSLGVIANDKAAFQLIATGALLLAEAKLKEERRQKLKVQQQLLHNRKALLAEIQRDCTESSKIKAYQQIFREKGQALLIPNEVIDWNISESLRVIALEDELEILSVEQTTKKANNHIIPETKPTEDLTETKPSTTTAEQEQDQKTVEPDFVEDEEEIEEIAVELTAQQPKQASPSPQQTTVLNEQRNESRETIIPKAKTQIAARHEVLPTPTVSDHQSTQPVPSTERPEHQHLPILQTYFSIVKVYNDSDFLYFLGKLKGSFTLKVVRFASTEQLNDQSLFERFKKLFEREATYYDHISSVFTTPNGRYYYRDHIAGDPLDVYIQQTGIDQKNTIEELNSSDLNFLIQAWDEVNNLKFGYKNLKAENIIVSTRRKWNLKKESDVMLIGITDDDYEKKEMEKDFHQLLEQLIGNQLYNQIIQHFKG